MEPKEQEAALDDVDRRIERLRTYYEQYFLGMERVAPADQRRDIDRMIRRLRTEHLRNTATKFRFQTLVQRYVTYSTYWDRITREIEEGTYKRVLDRIKRRADGRGGRKGREVELDVDVELDLGMSLDDADPDDMDEAIARAIREAEDEERRSLVGISASDLAAARPPPSPIPVAAASRAAVFTDEDFAAIDSAFDGMQLHDTVRPAAPGPEVDAAPAPGFAPPPALPQGLTGPKPQELAAPKPAARFSRPRDLVEPPAGALRAPAPPPPPALSLLDDDELESKPTPVLDPTPAARPARAFPPPPRSALPPPPAPRAAPAASGAGPMSAPPVPATGKLPAAPEAARVAPDRGAQPAARPRPPPPAAARPAPAARSDVDDETRKIYQRYVEARRQCNEPTHNVRIDSLARNLETIRKKHGGREIDFEVVIKDGRAAIKPVPR